MKVRKYKDLGYTSFFNSKTGFFARVEDKDKPEPFWSPYGPELMDISITNWCDKNCLFCYKKSNNFGRHMSFDNYRKVIDQAKEMGVFQVALGGGNPNQHPDFIDIIRYTAEQGIVPNYTTNGRGITEEILIATKKYCGAVAVSAYPPYTEMEDAISRFSQLGIKTNIHYILDSESIEIAIDWLNTPPNFISMVNAIVFLNYKPSGVMVYQEKMLRKSKRLQEFFDLATSSECNVRVGFDACSVSGVFSRTKVNTSFVDACDAGRFSLFVSEDMKVYACSFQAGLIDGDQLTDQNTLEDIWLNSDNMKSFRDYFKLGRCVDCSVRELCKNGCPIFDNIVVCGNR